MAYPNRYLQVPWLRRSAYADTNANPNSDRDTDTNPNSDSDANPDTNADTDTYSDTNADTCSSGAE